MSKCIGCGVTLQSDNPNKDGYVSDDDKRFCQRCFIIKNYGQNKITNKTNIDYMGIINNIRDVSLLNDILVSYGEIYLYSKKKLK